MTCFESIKKFRIFVRTGSRQFPTWLFAILIFIFALPVSTLDTIRITEPEGRIVLGIHTEFFEDKEGMLSFEDIIKL